MPTFFDALKDPEFRASVIRGLIDAGNRGAAIVAGAPVDAATQAANLGVAGVGYVGHKTGLMKTPPNLIDPATVPGSSEWIGRRMEQGGFVSADRNPTAEVLASLAIPMAAARVGPSLFAAEQRAAQNLAQPSTMRMQGQRGAVNIGGMDDEVSKRELEFAQQIHAQLSGVPSKKIGLRVLPPELGVPEVGAKLEPSFKFVNGEQTQRRLAGVSSANLGGGTLEETLRAIRNLGLFRTGPNGYYFGDNVAIVYGSGRRKGVDVGEAVIIDPVVSYVTRSPRARK